MVSDTRPNVDRAYRRAIRGWCMYDWANSAFSTTVLAAFFPPFYRSLVIDAGLAENRATAFWGYTTSVALILVAVMAPVLGATADHTGGRKRYAGFFVGLGVLATASFGLIGEGSWLVASILFLAGSIGFSGANLFYDSLLPHVASRGDIDQVSARGHALGYVGGGILLVVNALWVLRPALFGFSSADVAVRASFLSVAVWWGIFSVPFFRNVSEPLVVRRERGRPAIVEGLSRLVETFREIRKHRQLAMLLVAYWVYSDGIGTIIRMATAYGDEIGIELTDMVTALVITQFVGIPFSLLFGRIARRIGAKRSILIALAVYACVAVSAYFMRTALHFYVLAFVVGTVQGGSQALSRSLYGSMVPRNRAAEFFGFFSSSSKFAGVFGPLVFGVVSHFVGGSRAGVVSLIVFFVVGGLLLARVDVDEGLAAARRAETAE